MAERDYSNDYDDWLRDNPAEYQSRPENPRQPTDSVQTPAPKGPPYTRSNPPPAPRDGYEWIMDPATGVFNEVPRATTPATTNDPLPTTPTTPGPSGPTTSSPSFDWSSVSTDSPVFDWPQWDAPVYTPEQFDPYPEMVKRPDYKSLSLEEAMNEPGLKAGLLEGRKQIENSAAARGTLRSGGTLKDIFDWTNTRTQQGYDTAESRNFRNWGANNDLDFRTYGTNRDTYWGNNDRRQQSSLDAFDRRYAGERDMFSFNKFEPAKMTFNDAFNRWKAKLDAATAVATGGPD